MQSDSVRPSHIAIIGGGFTGMVCAFRLLQSGYRVTVLENQPNIGGLTTSHNYGSFRWDKFYHCILTSDSSLLKLLTDLDLENELRWTATNVGLFSHGKLHKMTGAIDLLRFPHLSLFNKTRLALATLYISRITDGKHLESVPLGMWTQRLFGKAVYRQIWEPLFRCKLGEMRRNASAAFLWGTLRRLASTREKGPTKQEKLGYVKGGYETVFSRLQQRVNALNGSVHTGLKVRSISASPFNKDRETSIRIATGRDDMYFDGVIMTVPNKAVAACLKTTDSNYLEQLAQVTYLGLICIVLVLKKRLSPFYVTNVTEHIGFTGVIEMTNLINANEETNGLHLVYLPRYTASNDPLFEASDDDLWNHFLPDLKRMFPHLNESDIVNRFVFKERTVQPVPTIEYSSIAPPVKTPVPGVYLANTAQIINSTLNNNVMASLAETACEQLMREIPPWQNRTIIFPEESSSVSSHLEEIQQVYP